MLFRRTYQYNIDSGDRYTEKKEGVDRLKEEQFVVTSFRFHLPEGILEVKDADAEIIESQNYFTIKKKKVYKVLKWSSVLGFEFSL